MIILRYLSTLILNNITKTILLVASIICFFWGGRIPDTTTTAHIISSFKDAGKYNYVTKSDRYSIITFDKEQKLDNNGNLTYVETSAFSILCYVIFGILVLILVIASLINDDETGWDLPEVLEKTMLRTVRCDTDGDLIYYSLYGKLLLKSDVIADDYVLRRHISAYCTSRNIFPDYKGTKAQIRDTKIKDIVK